MRIFNYVSHGKLAFSLMMYGHILIISYSVSDSLISVIKMYNSINHTFSDTQLVTQG